MMPRAILTDIEGTTSAISFVHEVLFPYASRALPDFVRSHADEAEIAALLEATRREADEPGATTERVIDILLGWIAEDVKATPLKSLQGHIWRDGYVSGAFTGHMYDDAVDGLRRWHAAGIELYVYSSGSVDAQKLIFAYSDAGDLTALFDGYFDTHVGHKQEVDSYRQIADSIGHPASDILFLSDVAAELDAAREAGMQTVQVVRDAGVVIGDHRVAHDFGEVILEQ